jgi:hypothetical protein
MLPAFTQAVRSSTAVCRRSVRAKRNDRLKWSALKYGS